MNWEGSNRTDLQSEMVAAAKDITADSILAGNITGNLAQSIQESITPLSRAIAELCWRFLPFPPENILKVPEIRDANIGLEYMGKRTIF